MYTNQTQLSIMCLNTFGLDFPPTKEELQKAYHRVIKLEHPDVGGSVTKAQEINTAYEELKGYTANEQESLFHKTVQGDNIESLGNGLGPITNGSICKKCEGKGYYSSIDVVVIKETSPCLVCLNPCNRCNGTKIFKHEGKDYVCVRCLNNKIPGYFMIIPFCLNCKGIRFLEYTKGTKERLHNCSNCNTTGEIEILNPVLQKGGFNVILGKTQKERKQKGIV